MGPATENELSVKQVRSWYNVDMTPRRRSQSIIRTDLTKFSQILRGYSLYHSKHDTLKCIVCTQSGLRRAVSVAAGGAEETTHYPVHQQLDTRFLFLVFPYFFRFWCRALD